jgi:hypothetical protein
MRGVKKRLMVACRQENEYASSDPPAPPSHTYFTLARTRSFLYTPTYTDARRTTTIATPNTDEALRVPRGTGSGSLTAIRGRGVARKAKKVEVAVRTIGVRKRVRRRLPNTSRPKMPPRRSRSRPSLRKKKSSSSYPSRNRSPRSPPCRTRTTWK